VGESVPEPAHQQKQQPAADTANSVLKEEGDGEEAASEAAALQRVDTVLASHGAFSADMINVLKASVVAGGDRAAKVLQLVGQVEAQQRAETSKRPLPSPAVTSSPSSAFRRVAH
jgi:hypothetical protein